MALKVFASLLFVFCLQLFILEHTVQGKFLPPGKSTHVRHSKDPNGNIKTIMRMQREDIKQVSGAEVDETVYGEWNYNGTILPSSVPYKNTLDINYYGAFVIHSITVITTWHSGYGNTDFTDGGVSFDYWGFIWSLNANTSADFQAYVTTYQL
eukprot:Gregarina_sp_Poly_1__7834@NODE_4440_length_596_cov_4_939509_g2967_i0_p1_GENE_NODE_4440_length_596_cov_4_939509_g2967_i0NODE_4440_length_596_cov_4_939509_g2967_i0_p1_ORF_typecomplete_len160_score13_43_NODE_4440_length_596_cov_4_939509_g2967_i024482